MQRGMVLGPADVSDDTLAAMVADLSEGDDDVGEVELLFSSAVEVAYDLPSITTAGRFWVEGQARVDGAVRDWRMFVKHIQNWSRSPLFQQVPDEVKKEAVGNVPWRTEALAYRSDLAAHLPDGLAMPRVLGVFDLDEESAVIWLEDVEPVKVDWDLERYTSAARLLGAFAATPTAVVSSFVEVPGWDVQVYLDGRLAHQVLPLLRRDDTWAHPVVAKAFLPDLPERLCAAADRAPELTAELRAFPRVTSHGDACPNNLLVRADRPGFTLIDFAMCNPMPLGFDLGQLLVGDVQTGRRGADDLAVRDEACISAYVDGLRAAGVEVERDEVRRAHALQLMLFSGLSTVPFEWLDEEPTADRVEVARMRADLARYSLDLLAATDP